jgi:hypothetical protein
VLALLLVSSPTLAAPITGVTIETVSSEYTNGWDLAAVHVIDGSGLSGSPATHSQIAYPGGQSWQTISQTGTAQIVFDLGASYALSSIHVWNLNFYAPYNGRGAKDVVISISSDLTGWSSAGTFVFSMATGLNGDPGFDILFGSALGEARYVEFNILSNWGGSDNAGHVGLSEVQFYADARDPGPAAVPEPTTVLLIGLGLAGLAGARRYKK